MNVFSKLKKISLMIFIITLLPLVVVSVFAEETTHLKSTLDLTETQKKAIEVYIGNQMKIGKIPGMAVVIVRGYRTVYLKGFGYADLKIKQPITPKTLFELGSTSKAFTGLAVLQLHDKKQLSLNDPVRKYIPWLKMKYREKEVDPRIEQFLYQTSGVPFHSIGDIPAASDNDALENTVKTLVGMQLDYFPGERFSYATINYDVLGLVIQEVSGVSFEEYMKTEILKPLGMHNTYLFRDEARRHGLAKGYKICFGNPREYDAPQYRGNTPAGYFITNAEDMARWLKIQMQMIEPPGFNMELIKNSHKPNTKIGSSYAAGWNVVSNKGETGGEEDIIFHAGGNPNFSSFILFRPGKKLGAAVLANIRSSYVDDIPMGIFNILQGREPWDTAGDQNLGVDTISIIVVIVSLVLFLVTLCFLTVFIVQFFRKMRKFRGLQLKGTFIFLLLTLFLVVLYYLLYRIPVLLFWGLNWDFILIWGPGSLLYGVICIIAASFFIYLYLLLRYFFPKVRTNL
ncbi:MAG: serine hydrolase domain-containing protein [Candidatus Aminicenantes bacterium]|jgi:CubicO group peptidase (beta-lactamase class C family)